MIPMILINGPTCTGKSEAAIALAKKINGEIISCDSMQIYRDMNIGTAKITEQQMQNVPHHMIDILAPNEQFSVAAFRDCAMGLIKKIQTEGKVPIFAGGTGLYFDALIYPFSFCESEKNDFLRSRLLNCDNVYDVLQSIDPQAAEILHPNDKKRIIRAIEIKSQTGKSITDRREIHDSAEHIMFTLCMPRDKLYTKINQRVDKMFEIGLEKEVTYIINKYNLTFNSQSMKAIGYKEFENYYNNQFNLEQLKDKIKQNSRRYAKRQITWYKKYNNTLWIDVLEKKNDIAEIMLKRIAEYENR